MLTRSSLLLCVALCVAMLSATAWAAPFMVGKQGTTPPPGMRVASLQELQTSMLSSFLNQYNSVGLPVQEGTLTNNCCMWVAEGGWLTAVSAYIYPCVNQTTTCAFNVVGYMRFGTNYQCYWSLSEADVRGWAIANGCQNPSYTLWADDSAVSTVTYSPSPSAYSTARYTNTPYYPYTSTYTPQRTPTYTNTPYHPYTSTYTPQRTPNITSTPYYPYTSTYTPQRTPTNTYTPSRGQYTCCLYFSPSEHYETSMCQRAEYNCPPVSGFSLVGSYPVSSCNDCSIYY